MKFLKSKNNQLTELVFVLEKLTNIAIVKVGLNETENAKAIIDSIENKLLKLLALKEFNLEKFQQITEAEDFYKSDIKLVVENYAINKDTDSPGLQTIFNEKNEYLEYKNQQRELKLMGRFWLSFYKIWASAKDSRNEEISTYLIYRLERILLDMSEKQQNSNQIAEILNLFSEMTREGLKEESVDVSVHRSSTDWYANIVFDHYRDRDDFNLLYLPNFDKNLFLNLRLIVKSNNDELFQRILFNLVDGISIRDYYGSEIYKYDDLLLYKGLEESNKLDDKYGIFPKITEISNLQKKLWNYENLTDLLEKFEILKKIIRRNIGKGKERVALAEEIEQKVITAATDQYKFNNLLKIVFSLGAYCLYEEKTDFIYELWMYKQPEDSDASWGGNDVIPIKIEQLMSLYFANGLESFRYDFGSGHHGSEIYYKRYFALLLAKIITSTNEIAISSYSLPDGLPSFKYSGLEHTFGGLKAYVDSLETKTLVQLKIIKVDSDADVLKVKIHTFINRVITSSKEKLSSMQVMTTMSPQRISEFKKEVLKSFNEESVIRGVYERFGNYLPIEQTKIAKPKLRFGINQVDEKGAFLDNWYISYGGWGEQYGRGLANGEDSMLLTQIINKLKIKEVRDAADIHKEIKRFSMNREVIIISSGQSLYSQLERDSRFTPLWRLKENRLDINGFAGYYEIGDKKIPVFESDRRGESEIILIDSNKMGKIHQYDPRKDKEPKSLISDFIYINIRSFSETDDAELLQDILEEPPQWLSEKGDRDTQKLYIKGRVLINIYESFELKARAISGVVLRVTSEV